jgi:hypothetical protein
VSWVVATAALVAAVGLVPIALALHAPRHITTAGRPDDVEQAVYERLYDRGASAVVTRSRDDRTKSVVRSQRLRPATLSDARVSRQRTELLAYVRHVQSMEHTFAETLVAPSVLCEVPVVRNDIARHRVECLRHQALLGGRLRTFGRDPHPSMDAVLSAWLGSILNAYDATLAVRGLFAAQRLKLDAYDVLERAAARANDGPTVVLARHHLVEEQARRRRMTRAWCPALLRLPSIADALMTAILEDKVAKGAGAAARPREPIGRTR